MKLKNIFFIVLGCIFLTLGTIGIFLPVLPTTPFYLLTLFFFTNSSQRLHNWFTGTKLYKKHLEPFIEHKEMPLQTKISIITTITLLMGFGIFMMARKGIWIPCIILAIIWIFHIFYFVFRIKTQKNTISHNTISVEEVSE